MANQLNYPRAPVGHIQPFRVARSPGKLFVFWIPFQRFSVIVGQIHEVADAYRPGADLHIANRRFAAADRGDPIAAMIAALVEAHSTGWQELLRDVLGLRGGLGLLLAAKPELEFAAVDEHFAVVAKKPNAAAGFVDDFHAVFVNETRAMRGTRLFGRKNPHRPAIVLAETPLRDVEMVRAPVGNHASAVFAILPPVRKMFV